MQWNLLKEFANGRGLMEWTGSGADRRNQKRRELLAKNLRQFFGIKSDPLVLTDNRKGRRTLFQISPVE